MLLTVELQTPIGAVLQNTKIGCCVKRTVPGLPAFNTLRPGDLIMMVNGEYVIGDNVQRVRSRFKAAPRASVIVTVWRFCCDQMKKPLRAPVRQRASSWPSARDPSKCELDVK